MDSLHSKTAFSEVAPLLPDFTPVFEAENHFSQFLLLMRKKQWDSRSAFLLRQQAEELTLHRGFEELLVIQHLREHWNSHGVILYPHQIDTVQRVVSAMRGKAILADEVGLGKTIEAAMILKEYLLRGLVKRFLILTPAALCRQWESELREKFEIPALIASREFEWSRYNQMIASLELAKQEKHRQEILKQDYDLVIIDEAHKLKNCQTQNWKFVCGIQKKYFLLLTATPLQNDLKELFNLITLIRPGQLGNYRSFKRNFTIDKRNPKNAPELKRLLSEVMIRNKHGAQIGFTKRNVQNIPITPSALEQEMYSRVTDFIRNCFQKSVTRIQTLPLLTLQREICSSTFAAVLTLYKLLQKLDCDETDAAEALALIRLSQQVKHNAKMEVVEELVRKSPEKIIIFTEFLATQSYVRTRLEQAGFMTLAFDGHLSATKKEFTKFQFKQQPQYRVLVCTESGGEGINLQFCNTMINYDLPWNPMRLEQRIGRIHRLGQLREVFIYNLYTRGTVEEYLLRLLDEKVRMFEMVIGESERVISKLCRGKSLEARIMDLVFTSASHEQLLEGFEALGREIGELIEEDNPDGWEDILTGDNI
jgi:SNF2 family DNA or RNA helicase